ncbi:MAG: hypothetical protein ABUL62_32780 [Myxococcales bacterium]
MGKRTRRHSTLALVTLSAALACGGRSLVDGAGSAGTSNVAGAVGSFAGAASSGAGAPSSGGASVSAGAPNSTGGSDDTDCVYDEDCTVLAKGCCGAFEPVDASQLVAVSSAHASEYQKTQCPTILPCLAEPPGTEYDETGKYFRAICFHPPNQPGQCQLLDVRGTPYTRCEITSECVLREGVECCPGCDGHGWVPVKATISFCSVSTPCDPCASAPPPGLETSCQAGTCRFAPPKR